MLVECDNELYMQKYNILTLLTVGLCSVTS
jgi:hypothetical protein